MEQQNKLLNVFVINGKDPEFLIFKDVWKQLKFTKQNFINQKKRMKNK